MSWLARTLSDRRKAVWLVLTALFVTRLQTLFIHVYNFDETSYVGHAQIMLNGGIPYVGFVEKKPPLIYGFYWLCFRIFGVDMVAVHAVTIVIVALTAWLIAKQIRLFVSDTHAAAGALIYVLFSTAFTEGDALATNCEVLMNLPAAAAGWALLRGDRAQQSSAWIFACGLFVGLAFLFKHQAGIELPVIGLYILLAQTSWLRRLRNGILAVAGFLLPSCVVIAIYVRLGHVSELYEWNVLTNVTYVVAGRPHSELLLNALETTAAFIAANLLPFFLAGAAIARRSLRAGADQLMRFHAIWLVAVVVPVAAGGHFYGHYYIQFYPPLCVLAGVAAGELLARHKASRILWRSLVVAALLGPALCFQVSSLVRYRNEDFEAAWSLNRNVADEIDRISSADDEIFVWGEYSAPYYFAKRRPATRYVVSEYVVPFWEVYLWHRTGPDDADFKPWHRAHFRLLMDDLRSHPPRVIVDTTRSQRPLRWSALPMTVLPELASFVASNYSPVAEVEGIAIFLRK